MSKKFQLKNGLTVLMIPTHKSPVVSVQMWVKTGSADEKKGEEGISHFIEHLVFKGTEKFGVGEIASTIEGAGGELNAYTSFDQTVFYVTISKHFVETGLEAISEMMGFPEFDSQEIDNEREVVLEEIKRTNDSPHRQASRLLFSTIYKKHPYGIPVIGYDKNIRKVSRETLLDYYHRRYVPENMTLVVVGDFEPKDMRKLVKQYYDKFEPYKLKKITRTKEPAQERSRIKVTSAPFEETLLHIAWRVPKVSHKDIPALDVLSMILGQGDSSRLMRAMRIEKSLTNYTVASTFTPKDPGFFIVSSSLNFVNLTEALAELSNQIQVVLSEACSETELNKAIVNLEGDEFYSLETVDGMARKVGSYEELFGDHNYYQEFLKQVSQLTPLDLLKVARKYLKPESMIITMMTPADEKAAKLELQKWSRQYKKLFEKSKKTKAVRQPMKKQKRLSWKIANRATHTKMEKITLPSGASLILRPSHETPVVSLRCAFLGGQRIEDNNQEGLTELLSRAWVAGAGQYSEQQVHEMTDSMAASLSAFGGRNTTGLTMTALSPFASEVADLFAQTLLNPTLPKEVIEREKNMMLENIKTRDDNPAQIAILNFMDAMFAQHPYSRDPNGKSATVKTLTKADVSEHLGKMVHSRNMALVLAGDFHPGEWKERLEKVTDKLSEGQRLDTIFEFSPPAEDMQIYKSSEKEQSHIVVGYPGLTFKDEERYTLKLIQSILAGQGGRLFLELRDKESLAYSVAPLKMEGVDAGYFGAYIGCSPEKSEKSIAMLNAEFEKLTQTKVLEKELERSKRYLIGRHDIELQKTSSVAASILFDDVYGVAYDETFHFAEHISDITEQSILNLAQKIFSQPSVTSVVGPRSPF